MTLEEIKELIQLVKDSGVAELEVQRGENRVWVKRTAPISQEFAMPAAAPAAYPAAPVYAPAAPDATGEPPADAVTSDPSLVFIPSPIVGTFYDASAPAAPPFVKVGDSIQPGKVLCIIESMKLMNEIEAEISGTIVAKLVENGKPVEYGEKLFAVKPS
ncbi:MAG: acetyl-CoA carboxylase biotin carboxyl carrier protein [Acidobacteria bacterium]|nr:acetyl-CoA carboxylase biotin carboxyl carrier protein [Acidobacteriota bacterium]